MPTIFESPVPHKKSDPVVKKYASGKTMGPLTYFAVNPSGVRFETQQADEEIVLFLRQHLIVNVPWLLIAGILLLSPTVLFPFLFRFIHLPFVIPAGYMVVGIIFWYVFTFGFILLSFLHWYFNIYIVTNERIVDIDFVNLLYKEFSEARLANIQDTTYKIGGIVETLFNYGNVYIQTAGEWPNFEFVAVPRPDSIVQTISELIEKINGGHL